MQIAIDEVYLRELISRPLQEGVKPPERITYLPPPPPHGAPKEAIELWLARSRSQTRLFVYGWPSDWHPHLKHESGLEPMNALEWLKGYEGHEAVHHRQLDGLIQWCRDSGVT